MEMPKLKKSEMISLAISNLLLAGKTDRTTIDMLVDTYFAFKEMEKI